MDKELYETTTGLIAALRALYELLIAKETINRQEAIAVLSAHCETAAEGGSGPGTINVLEAVRDCVADDTQDRFREFLSRPIQGSA